MCISPRSGARGLEKDDVIEKKVIVFLRFCKI